MAVPWTGDSPVCGSLGESILVVGIERLQNKADMVVVDIVTRGIFRDSLLESHKYLNL